MNRLSFLGASGLCVVAAILSYAVDPGPAVRVGPNYQVSGDVPGQQFEEVWMGSNPQNERELVACAIGSPVSASQYRTHTAVFRSIDGGRSWRRVLEVGDEDDASDPVCDFASDGTLYFSTLRVISGSRPYNARTEIYRSEHGGPLELQQSVRIHDRDSITVDHWRDRKRPEKIYAHGSTHIDSMNNDSLFAVAVYPRAANGRFEDPRISAVLDTRAGGGIASNQGVVLEDGSFGTVEYRWTQRTNSPDLVDVAFPGGVHLDWLEVQPDEAQKAIQSHEITVITPCPSFLDNGFPRAAIDASSSAFRGRIYVAWAAERYDRCRIFLSSSDDRGRSWSTPAIVDGPAEFYDKSKWNSSMPALAVNSGGVLGISWYDRTGIENQISRTARFAASLDGGVTLLPSVEASSAPDGYSEIKSGPVSLYTTDRRYQAAPSRAAEFGILTGFARGGETGGITADARGRFHLLWTDNRTGASEMWTSAIEVEGSVNPGAPDLSGPWRDLTQDVVVEYSNATYDSVSRTIMIDARLSTSTASLKGASVTLRITRASSPFGVIDPDSGTAPAKTYEFTFGSEQQEGRYYSNTRRLHYRLREAPRVSRDLASLLTVSFLRIESRIYSR